ncbi:MAG TPA: isochorismatase family cysteine hydrolase, partial [Rubrobacter sp.]|nr:isochorismatase family cysteine hydrolase [Rubrobacter sp.]
MRIEASSARKETYRNEKRRGTRVRNTRGGSRGPHKDHHYNRGYAERVRKGGGSLLVPDAEATIPNIKSLLGLARESGMKVVFTQDTHNEGDPEWEIWPEHVREGSWGWEIVDELSPREDELVVRKVRYDAFYGTHLDHYLRVWGVDTLVICGTVANICVHYTAASAALR